MACIWTHKCWEREEIFENNNINISEGEKKWNNMNGTNV